MRHRLSTYFAYGPGQASTTYHALDWQIPTDSSARHLVSPLRHFRAFCLSGALAKMGVARRAMRTMKMVRFIVILKMTVVELLLVVS
jgi:hypothetical protein